MAVSRKSGRTSSQQTFLGVFDGLSRYDLMLALVPLGFAMTLLAYVLFAISLHQAVAGGAVFGLAMLVDALFLNPPSEEPPRSTP